MFDLTDKRLQIIERLNDLLYFGLRKNALYAKDLKICLILEKDGQC